MNINGYEVTDRNNRPSVDSRVALRVFFMNDGQFIDPAQIVDVAVFSRSANQDPSSLLKDDGTLNDPVVSGLAKAFFEIGNENGWLDVSEYEPEAPGVYRIRQGEFVVVLDGLTPATTYASRWNAEITNTASATGDYLDVWTVRYPTTSETKVVINAFSLYDDTFYTTTEPLMIKTNNELVTKKIPLGSKQDVKITTEFTVENRNIDSSIRNLFKTSIATQPKIKIEKINDDPNLPSRVTVYDYADTSGSIRVSSENTFIYTWDTDLLRTHTQLITGNLGNMRGLYAISLQYNLLTERIIAPLMYIQLV
jgi:hypothetical protein